MSHDAQPPMATQVQSAFGVETGEFRNFASSGFEADGFTDGDWFVKLWRYEPDSDVALALTGELADRGIPVPAAHPASDGSYTAEHDGRRYALFPFVEGTRATPARDTEVIARAMRSVHEVTDLGLALPRADLEEWCIEALRDRRDHPWISERRDEVLASVDRLEAVIDKARTIEVPVVVCHQDFFSHNILVAEDGKVAALLDWGHTMFAPREHDLIAALCEGETARFLQAYDAYDLDLTHLEYARLARSVRDLAIRVVNEVDRAGLESWGFEPLSRVDADLALARPFCR